MGKPNYTDSFVNMVGEFINLNKNPEFRLSPSSEKYIAKAVQQEKKKSTVSITNIWIGMETKEYSSRKRTSNSTCIPPTSTIKIDKDQPRRFSVPLLKSKLKKFKTNSMERPKSVITESNESVNDLQFPRSRHSSRTSSLLGDIAKYCNEMSAIHTRI